MRTPKLFFAAVSLTLTATLALARSGPRDLAAVRKSLPEKITRITPEDLVAQVPSFYYFDYNADPHPGKRLWIPVTDRKWIERYPNGMAEMKEVE